MEDISKRKTFDQDFQRLRTRAGELGTPEARALLADIKAGMITPDTLKDIANIFTGKGALPFTLAEGKAMLYN